MPCADEPGLVSNSGPLIALASVGRLDLIPRLHGSVAVPEAVWNEVVGAGDLRPGSSEIAAASWVSRVEVSPPPDSLLADELGQGEAEAIVLARQHESLLLLDDRRARRIARVAYGVAVRGTAGLLVHAKRTGLLEEIRPVLHAMRNEGYYLSDRIVDAALQAAEE